MIKMALNHTLYILKDNYSSEYKLSKVQNEKNSSFVNKFEIMNVNHLKYNEQEDWYISAFFPYNISLYEVVQHLATDDYEDDEGMISWEFLEENMHSFSVHLIIEIGKRDEIVGTDSNCIYKDLVLQNRLFTEEEMETFIEAYGFSYEEIPMYQKQLSDKFFLDHFDNVDHYNYEFFLNLLTYRDLTEEFIEKILNTLDSELLDKEIFKVISAKNYLSVNFILKYQESLDWDILLKNNLFVILENKNLFQNKEIQKIESKLIFLQRKIKHYLHQIDGAVYKKTLQHFNSLQKN